MEKKKDATKETGRWANDEHDRFMAAIATYGKDWKKVQQLVGTRSGSQVRSHAQKFFNKLLKQDNDKKNEKGQKQKEGHENQGEDSENSFPKDSHDDASNTTPIQLVTLIRGQSQKDATQKVNLKSFQKKLEEHLAVIQEENNEEQLLDNLKRQKSYKSFNNILDAYETVREPGKNTELENESFLIGLTRRYKKYFAKGGAFENLIDFGNSLQVQKLEKKIRKRSFTLPEGVEGDDSDLEERKKRVVTESGLAKLTQQQRQSYAKAVQSLQSPEQRQNQQRLPQKQPQKKEQNQCQEKQKNGN